MSGICTISFSWGRGLSIEMSVLGTIFHLQMNDYVYKCTQKFCIISEQTYNFDFSFNRSCLKIENSNFSLFAEKCLDSNKCLHHSTISPENCFLGEAEIELEG